MWQLCINIKSKNKGERMRVREYFGAAIEKGNEKAGKL